jgi:protein-histidine pros-kinase
LSLLLRVNLVFLALAMCLSITAGYACRTILQADAQRELLVRPLRRIAALADSLSVGKESGDEFPSHGAREIQALGAAFNRMRKSLAKAMQMLGS